MIRNADFRESMQKSARTFSKVRAFFGSFGGGGGQVAGGTRAVSVFSSAASGVRTSTCHNATHKKPQACELWPK